MRLLAGVHLAWLRRGPVAKRCLEFRPGSATTVSPKPVGKS